MRLWSISPQYLDSKGLVACWSEGLLAQSCLLKGEYTTCQSVDKFGYTCDRGYTKYNVQFGDRLCKKCKGKGKIKTPYCLNKKSYPYVTLYKNRKGKKYNIHRLLAEHFISKPILEVNHKNGDKQDFRLENLEWVTRRENNIHANIKGLKKYPNKSSKYTGVGYIKSKNLWRAYTKINGKYKHLGYFKTEKEAYVKYCLINNL